MCVTPHKLADGSLVPCRVCWQCRENRINDWVGRCIAESKTAMATHSVTLTYGRDEKGSDDHLRAALLTYSDVQMYLKLLRRHGYPCRYFAVGEYGSQKGRAHWHLILFWLRRVPNHQLNQRFVDARHWRHGFQHWEPVSDASIRYVMKYIQKDMGDDERQGHMSMSKKPPLGAEYFRRLACDYVKQGLAPQSLVYWFPDVINPKTEKPRHFMLAEGSASADLFLSTYLAEWKAARGGFTPYSELVQRYEDKLARNYDLELRFTKKLRVPVPQKPPAGGTEPHFSEKHNCYYSDTPYGRMWFSYNSEGDLLWHEKIGPRETLSHNQDRLRPGRYREASRGL